jgi:chromosome segregation ATPase
MKGATVMELEPIMTRPAAPAATFATAATEKARVVPATLTVTKPSLASVEPQLQRRRDEERRKILESELSQEEQSLNAARGALTQEQQNPTLIAAVRMAQTTADPTPAQLAEIRANLEKASGKIRGLQATVAEHEKNVEALRKELGALKP